MSSYYQFTDFMRDGESEYYMINYFRTVMPKNQVESAEWEKHYLEWGYGGIQEIDDDYWSYERIVSLQEIKPVDAIDIKSIEKYHHILDLEEAIESGKIIQESDNE